MRRGDYRNCYKGLMGKIKGEGRGWRREVELAGMGYREGEKIQTIVTE